MSEPIVQRVAAKAVIVNSAGKILILREASTNDEGTVHGTYVLPGGRINPGEPFFEGLKREIQEETGLDVQAKVPVYLGEWFPNIKGVPNHIVSMFILCEPSNESVTLNEEHDDYQWIDASQVGDYDMMPEYVAAIKAWARRTSGRI
jgi:8-oxo-dGTP pyrophosphatase MutT (NUDIX family)